MNKKWGKKLLLVLIIMCILYLPKDIKADQKTGCLANLNKEEIFGDSGYKTDRRNGYWEGKYYNGVSDRKITIKVDHPKKYRVLIFEGKTGTISSANHLAGVSKSKLAEQGISIRTIEEGSLVKSGNGKNNEITVPAGHEALIVLLYKGKADDTKDDNDNCKKPNGNGKSVDNCCVGVFKQSDNFDDDVIYGTGADIFVDNPKDEVLVPNLRAVNASSVSSACTNAYNGIFQPVNKETEDDESNFTIKSEWGGDLNVWRTQYFDQIFPYCNTKSVSFNLSEHSIKVVSNRLLRMYKYITLLQSAGSANYDNINAEINKIKADLDSRNLSNNYYIKDNGTSIGNSNVLNSSLQCNYSDLVYNKTEKKGEYKAGADERDYLYAVKNSVNATIETVSGNSTTYKVCDTACYEHLKVVYSPPQVVKAGLCFQYKVTVKSVTDCGADFNEELKNALNPDNMYPQMCSATPSCNGDDSKVTAGPSQDFDNCVSVCDGGKYTQSCINKCYKKVYGDTSKKSSNNSEVTKSSNIVDNIKEVKPTIMINSNSNSNLIKVANTNIDINKLKEDKDFENYYNSNKLPSKKGANYSKICGTNDDIHKNLEVCAEYFFTAKSIQPYGKYSCDKNGKCSWNKTGKGGDCKSSYYGCSIAKVSTYFTRDLDSTITTLKRLIGGTEYGLRNDKRRYIVNDNGILVQQDDGTGWKCGMSCSYHGCTNDNAFTSSKYTELIIKNLESINNALRDCNKLVASNNNNSCDPSNGVKTSTFDINIKTNTKRGSDEPGTKTGSNELHSSLVDPPEPNCPDDKMFVKADKNDSSSSLNGIFGTCYNEVGQDDNGNRVHYQTTITFPGSWIDLKTGEVFYDCKEEGYKNKVQYYCTPFDSFNVNTNWWNWAVNNEYNGSAPAPDDWNIEAHLGFVNERNEDVGFGKYKWHIGFQCFYSQLDEIIGSPLPPPDGPSCYRGKEGTSEECPDDSDKKGTSTKVNYDIRIVDLENLFPNNRLRGFNWGDDAQLKSTDPQIQTALKTTGYGVSPVDYSHIVQGLDSYGGEGGEKIYDKDYDLRVVLNADNVAHIKNQKIDDFSGSYTAVNNIPGLYYYRMPDTFLSLVSSYDINWERGKNSKMAIKVTK